jgi:hypothetical protein
MRSAVKRRSKVARTPARSNAPACKTASTAWSMLSTTKPVTPSSITSGVDPDRKAMTGVPQAIASIMTRPKYLYRGIAGRAFQRRFELADHVKVVGAGLVNGLLTIDLKHELPEEMKPRRITITSSGALPKVETKQIETEKLAA